MNDDEFQRLMEEGRRALEQSAAIVSSVVGGVKEQHNRATPIGSRLEQSFEQRLDDIHKDYLVCCPGNTFT